MDFWAKFGTATKLVACVVVVGVAQVVTSRSLFELFDLK